MTPASDPPRASRSRRQVDVSRLALRLAFAAGVILSIVVVFTLVIRKLDRSPPVQPEYAAARPNGAGPGAAAGANSPGDRLPATRQGIPDIESKRPQIQAALAAFFQTANVEDRAALARHRERVLPLMMRYYQQQPLRIRQVSGLGKCMSVAEKGQRLGYIEVQFTQGPVAHAIIDETDDGRFLVDWESLTRYSEISWDELLRRPPQKPVLMRLLATREIGMGKAKDKTWLQLASPGHKKTLKAHFDPRSPEMAPLVDQLDLGGWKNVPLTLRVCYSENNSAPGTIQVVGIEGKGWLILN